MRFGVAGPTTVNDSTQPIQHRIFSALGKGKSSSKVTFDGNMLVLRRVIPLHHHNLAFLELLFIQALLPNSSPIPSIHSWMPAPHMQPSDLGAVLLRPHQHLADLPQTVGNVSVQISFHLHDYMASSFHLPFLYFQICRFTSHVFLDSQASPCTGQTSAPTLGPTCRTTSHHQNVKLFARRQAFELLCSRGHRLLFDTPAVTNGT